jgi:hypothetical protein
MHTVTRLQTGLDLGQNLNAGRGNQHRVFELRRQTVVAGDRRPPVRPNVVGGTVSNCDHRLDGKRHANLQSCAHAAVVIVEH